MKISVVMAVFNGEDYLEDTVKSILEQSYRDFEFIIVNDGSTDSTGKILEQFKDRRIRLIQLDHNSGPAAALNLAVQNARGSWIAVQDTGDMSLPERLERQERYLRIYPHIAALFSLIECLPGKKSFSELELRAVEKLYNSVCTRAQIYANRFYALHLCHGSAIYSKKLFQLAGGYDPQYRLAYDYDLWVRLLMLQAIDKIPLTLYRWRADRCTLYRLDDAETCREVILVALRSIRRLCFEHLKSRPQFILFGPEKGCWHFSQRIAPYVDIQFCAYQFTERSLNLDAALRLYNLGLINGIVVLDGPCCADVLRYFNNSGMSINRNLFHLWNVHL
ncbi:MAG TPA: glycosyltransferase [Bacillota bacterium]|jgi:glycosyltransferase involved in cell wall biosynthesis|nr:glycosyltransferase [Bacillota bacterium]HOA35679.1 glycosyltransferase [Bacillota bacterium]HOJ84155.1 glycosyltransferase [Bacillota bacterium]HOL16020.1 glycosyltransferase [Bacillota bacterium]HPZ11600.1 glycosyltransferase [Bacillota bacterium]